MNSYGLITAYFCDCYHTSTQHGIDGEVLMVNKTNRTLFWIKKKKIIKAGKMPVYCQETGGTLWNPARVIIGCWLIKHPKASFVLLSLGRVLNVIYWEGNPFSFHLRILIFGLPKQCFESLEASAYDSQPMLLVVQCKGQGKCALTCQ